MADRGTSSGKRGADGSAESGPGLAVIERVLSETSALPASERGAAEAIVSSLYSLQQRAGGLDVLTVLHAIATSMPQASDVPSSRVLSAEQERVLRAAGSFVEEMPPVAERASTAAARRGLDLIADSLDAAEVAEMLGVTESRIRQRVGKRSLVAIRAGSSYLFPRFQFVGGREMLGWDQVAPAFPASAHPVSIASFMTTPHCDLVVDGESVSPTAWLTGGGPAAPVVALAEHAFHVRQS